MQQADILRYVTDPMALAGLALLVSAGVVRYLSRHARDRKSLQLGIMSVAIVGAITATGGIGLEAVRAASERPPAVTQEASADGGGTAISARGNVRITSEGAAHADVVNSRPRAPGYPVKQKATASHGGLAVAAEGDVAVPNLRRKE